LDFGFWILLLGYFVNLPLPAVLTIGDLHEDIQCAHYLPESAHFRREKKEEGSR
jgi:hypothetical protein